VKASYPTVRVTVGGTEYTVHLRVIPARAYSHAGADSPDHMRPGSRPRISVIRILRDGEDCDLFWATRQAIEKAAVSAMGGAWAARETSSAAPLLDPEDYR
jgi:hypothetical protein